VRARDQEEEPDGAQKDKERSAQLTSGELLQTDREVMPVRVIGRIDALTEQIDFGLQALRGHSRFEPADHAKKMRVRMPLKKRAVHCGRYPELHVGLGKIETLRHNADNGVRLAI